MTIEQNSPRAAIPSVDRILRDPSTESLVAIYGVTATKKAIRATLNELRLALASNSEYKPKALEHSRLLEKIADRLKAAAAPSLRPVFNLTGTVLHTNFGRAPLPKEVADAISIAALQPTNLEYDIDKGRRGDRDSHIENRLCKLTGAEAATVVNNNAAAVLLILNTLALRREVAVSRGELIEIGGSFRIPDIMARAGCKLREVGTTNRTHLQDFMEVINKRLSLIMKVHTSNYVLEGFTATVPESELAALASSHDIPFVVDLGSGSIVDLSLWNLPCEPTPQKAFESGADIVTFSGDKLLGGPQAGIILGRADLIKKLNGNPMKRAMRLGKLSVAALEAILRIYDDPDQLSKRLPALRLLTRRHSEIEGVAKRIQPILQSWIGGKGIVSIEPTKSQIGSGAQPNRALPSVALAVRTTGPKRGNGGRLKALSELLRKLPIPVIGRIDDNTFLLDMRCLEDEPTFIAQLKSNISMPDAKKP